jgi:hypothetical protein
MLIHYLTMLALMNVSEIIPWLSSEPAAKRKPKGVSNGVQGAPTLLDQFLVTVEDGDGTEHPDIVMNEDGTMVGAGDQELF